ncbi:MAG TPA: SHOCT domain-containing protein [Candidatus Krumholzibacterium sp.]|nr:SHOCT domain-containing protein [Candidatus Krumholzibacterium sp.]
MGCYHWGGHWFWGFGIFPLIFLVMMVFCLFRWTRARRYRSVAGDGNGVRSFCGCRSWRGWNWSPGTGSAEEILDRRFASGDITEEQYRRMKTEMDKCDVD